MAATPPSRPHPAQRRILPNTIPPRKKPTSSPATLRSKIAGSRGWTWAFSLAELYSGEFGAVLDATETEELPPWQSVHPRCTVFVGCMVGSSVEVWQEMQPEDLRSPSSCDWPRNGPASCGAR